MDFTFILILGFFGVVGGFISGLLGVGGGIVFVPVLSTALIHLGYEDPELSKYILANSFAATFFAGAISSYKQYKLNAFYPKEVLFTCLTAVPSSVLLSYLIANGSWYDKSSFSIFFIFLLVLMLLKFLYKSNATVSDETKPSMFKFSFTGLLTGVIAGLSGLGGGVIMIPLFTQYLKMGIKKSASISIGVIPIMMIPMILLYGSYDPIHVEGSQWGYILPGMFFPLVGGLLFAAPLGVTVGQKSSSKRLKIIFAVLIVAVIIKTIGNIIA